MREELDDYFCRFSFGQFITLAILELATLFFVFYMGARYGPELFNHAPTLSSQEKLIVPDGEPKTVEEIIGKEGYTYPDLLSDKASTPESPKGEAPVILIQPTDPVLPEEAPPPVAKTEAKNGAASPPSQAPVKLHKQPESEYKFSIQVGSYQTANDASTAIDRWRAKSYDAYMSIGEIPARGTWYRVRVGGFGTRTEAEAFAKTFKNKEKVPAFVVLADS